MTLGDGYDNIVVTMHIDDLTYSRNGKTYRRVLLRNSYRQNGKVRHDTIANLSSCSDEEITAMKFALKSKNNLPKLIDLKENLAIKQGPGVGAVWTLFQTAKQFGIPGILGNSRLAKLALWLIISTAMNQTSRLSATRLAQFHNVCGILNIEKGFHEDDLYQAMDWLATKQESIEKALFIKRYKNKTPQFYLYDVTSSYFEGQHNELGAYGYNRDKKKGKKQIVIGLMTDENGDPIAVEVFSGNTNDSKTVAHQIKKMAEQFGVTEVTLVGDRGMIKSQQIEDLNKENFHFITAITKAQIESLIGKGELQLELFDEKLVEVQIENIRYVLHRNPTRAYEIAEGRKSKEKYLQQAIDKKNLYLKEHKKASVEIALREINTKIEKLRIGNWVKLIADERRIFMNIDAQKKNQASRLDGCYVLKTDLPSNYINVASINSCYKNLAVVEQAFRTMKTTLLEMRGIYVRKANRTRAHVFVIMLAYLLVHRLYHAWEDINITVEEGITELASICAMEINIPGCAAYQTIPEPRDLGSLLLKKAGVTLPSVLPCQTKNVYTRKKLISERKSQAR